MTNQAQSSKNLKQQLSIGFSLFAFRYRPSLYAKKVNMGTRKPTSISCLLLLLLFTVIVIVYRLLYGFKG